MKRLLLMVGLSLTTLSGYAQTQADRGPEGSRTSGARGISTTATGDAAQIVLACINQPGFEKYYAANGAGPVNIIGLPEGTMLPAKAAALGHPLSLQSAGQIAAGSLSNYFSVGKISNDGKQVSVSLTYFYSHSAEGYKVIMADVQLVHNGDQYQIVNANFNGDLL